MPNEEPETLSERLMQLKNERGVSYVQLSKLLAEKGHTITPQGVAKILKGEPNYMDVLNSLIEILNQ